nr:hypothetical protein [Acinetobacter ursingii]
MTAIAPKIGCAPETLRVWYQKHLDKDNPIKVLQVSQEERIKQLERENNQLQRANERACKLFCVSSIFYK